MKTMHILAAAAALLLAAGTAPAQPGPGYGAAASAPRSGPMGGPMGGRMGANGPMGGPMAGRMGASAPMMGGRMGGHWGSEYTPGWALMTPQEREEHQARMQSMQGRDECAAYVKQHREQMAARATEKGLAKPRQPARDACAGLKP
jgi:hypothetical protein